LGRTLSTGNPSPPPRAYRKIVVVAAFPWLTHSSQIPGHMTLLYWNFSGGAMISIAQTKKVKSIVAKYDQGYRRNATPKKGQSYLFDIDSNVDPQGPVARMIHEFNHSGTIDHQNSCGQSGTAGLHVTAGLLYPPIRFDENSELLARHPTSWARGKKGWELPLTLQCTCHLAPMPANLSLFNHLMSRGKNLRSISWAQSVADHEFPITSVAYALANVKGIGPEGA
jgi:hypothetical protein